MANEAGASGSIQSGQAPKTGGGFEMDPVTATAGATAASGLIQGLLSMEAEKRKLKLQKQQFDIQQRENRLSQEISMMNQQAQAPVQQAQAQAGTYGGLIQALGGTR